MLDVILVPTDLSADALAAAQLAAALAGPRRAVVHLVHADTLPGGATEGEPPAGVGAALWRAFVPERAAGLDRLLAAIGDSLGDVTARHIVVYDETSTAILNQAQLHGASLIVMGSHGAGGDRALLGSVAAAVAVRAPIPVLITRAAHRPPRDGWFHAPLVAVPRQPLPRSASAIAELIAPGATVDLLPGWADAADEPSAAVADVMTTIAASPPLDRFETRVHPADERLTDILLSRLEARSHDVVVFGPRAGEDGERTGLGFLADRLVHGAAAPVLLLPGAGALSPE